jgi:hypothetical protein
MCEKNKDIIYTNKKEYECYYPEEEDGIVHMWILDNKKEWGFFTYKVFVKYFDTIENFRKNKIDEIFKRY